MNGPGLVTAVASGLPWVAWEPLTLGELLATGTTAVFGAVALSLVGYGLRQMRLASEARNRQLDAQAETLAALTDGMRAATRSLETLLERTAPGAGSVRP